MRLGSFVYWSHWVSTTCIIWITCNTSWLEDFLTILTVTIIFQNVLLSNNWPLIWARSIIVTCTSAWSMICFRVINIRTLLDEWIIIRHWWYIRFLLHYSSWHHSIWTLRSVLGIWWIHLIFFHFRQLFSNHIMIFFLKSHQFLASIRWRTMLTLYQTGSCCRFIMCLTHPAGCCYRTISNDLMALLFTFLPLVCSLAFKILVIA